MLRLASVPLCLAWLAACVAGCFGPVDADCELDAPPPKLLTLQDRYALGSGATIDLGGIPPFTLESSDSSVVRVDRVGRNTADLSFVGPGQANLVLANEDDVIEQWVEVARHQTFVVVLSEVVPIPIGELSDATLLAGWQFFLVLYLDSDGERLSGQGLAEFGLSPHLQLCDKPEGTFEHHRLCIDEAGPHLLEVAVGDERVVLPFQAVLERDIVDIEVLYPDEVELRPGTWVQVDVVGVTADGSHVASVHPAFASDSGAYVGYFAYQFVPSALPEQLDIYAIDRSRSIEFRGTPSEETAVGCAASESHDEGPVPAMLTLAGLALFTHKRSRSAW
jgi:hypothetical protein